MAPRVDVLVHCVDEFDRIETFSIVNHGYKGIISFLENAKCDFIYHVGEDLESHDAVEIRIFLTCEFTKILVGDADEERNEKQEICFRTQISLAYFQNDLKFLYEGEITENILLEIAAIEKRDGICLILSEILEMRVEVSVF